MGREPAHFAIRSVTHARPVVPISPFAERVASRRLRARASGRPRVCHQFEGNGARERGSLPVRTTCGSEPRNAAMRSSAKKTSARVSSSLGVASPVATRARGHACVTSQYAPRGAGIEKEATRRKGHPGGTTGAHQRVSATLVDTRPEGTHLASGGAASPSTTGADPCVALFVADPLIRARGSRGRIEPLGGSRAAANCGCCLEG
jgi:hypothetical protein